MAKAKTGEPLVIHLDSRVALEWNLLNRHKSLPASRRQEWLRGLLLQGFRDECKALNGAHDSERRRPMMAFTRRISRRTPPPVATCEPVSMARAEQASTTRTVGKPFTALGKVIGSA
jgi:hypothetical protein